MKIRLLILGLVLATAALVMGAAFVAPSGGSITTTNTPQAGYVLTSDGTIYYWSVATATATNAQPPSTGLTNLTTFTSSGKSNAVAVVSGGGQITNAFKRIFIETNFPPTAISNIISGASFGDSIEFGAGDFRLGFMSLRPPPGVRLKGQGNGATRIHGFGSLFTNGPVIIVASSNVIEDLDIFRNANSTVTGAGIGFNYTRSDSSLVDSAATNFLIRRVRCLGWDTDSMYFAHTNFFSGRLEECEGYSQQDNLVVTGVGIHAGATNWVEVMNCKWLTDGIGALNGASDVVGVRVTVANVLLANNIVTATNGANAYAIKGSGTNSSKIFVSGGLYQVAGTNSVYMVDTTATFDPTNVTVYTFGNPFVKAQTSAGSIVLPTHGSYSNLIVNGTFSAAGVASFNTANIATLLDIQAAGGLRMENVQQVPRALMVNSSGDVTNVTSADPENEYVKADGSTGVPSAGSGSPGGNEGSVQVKVGSNFYGTNSASTAFIYDYTNGFLGLNLGGRFPNAGIEIGTAGPGGALDEYAVRVGGGSTTNSLTPTGMANNGSIGMGSAVTTWSVSGTANNAYLSATSMGMIGQPAKPHAFIATYTSNYTDNAVANGSGLVSIHGTNQTWKIYATTNVTIALRDLLSNVVYTVDITNNTSTITHSNSVQWWDGPLLTSSPALQQGRYRLAFVLNDHGTNGWIVTGRQFDWNVGSTHLVAITNTTTGLVTWQVTNFTGSGAIMLSNAPIATGVSLLADTILVASNANNAILRAANSNSVPTTNIFGITHKAAATPLILDANHGRNFTITNRYGAASTIVLTNMWDGDEVTIVAIGEASGGSSRVITLVGHGGGSAAIADLDTFGTAIAASKAFTLTNGNAVEISCRTTRMLQSNVTAVVTRQFAY